MVLEGCEMHTKHEETVVQTTSTLFYISMVAHSGIGWLLAAEQDNKRRQILVVLPMVLV